MTQYRYIGYKTADVQIESNLSQWRILFSYKQQYLLAPYAESVAAVMAKLPVEFWCNMKILLVPIVT